MANEKDLKTLAIDGVALRTVLNNQDIGKVFQNKFDNVPVTAGVVQDLSPITVTEPGYYIIDCDACFSAATTTGQTTRYVGIRSAQGNGASSEVTTSNNAQMTLQSLQISSLQESDVPLTFYARVYTTRDCTVRWGGDFSVSLSLIPRHRRRVIKW